MASEEAFYKNPRMRRTLLIATFAWVCAFLIFESQADSCVYKNVNG
jgi:hypothetical protein